MMFGNLLTNNKSQVLMLMNFVAFQTLFFIRSYPLIVKIEKFIKKYENILFESRNAELYLYSLLILCNYQDDMFIEDSEMLIFQFILHNFIEERKKTVHLD